ncbi:MAG TPA: tRNA (N6-threonylcarbamoyladenosine(37)-N6)-methyltransferase TrmO [Bacillota bacterium]|nr:tRNA (N6-threonylcarbamoyladenosine(37)-N6)-methyltransferase TrmO [Bacillota bacterium]
MNEIILKSIATVNNDVTVSKVIDWGKDISTIVLEPEYIGGLKGLDAFSHCIILYYLSEAAYDPAIHLQRHAHNLDSFPLNGIFAQRSKNRPNTIGMTSVEIIEVRENALVVKGLDALNGTPILDIKPYYPQYDRRDATVPNWVNELMKEYF